jgi:hypothetical protein
VGLIVVAGLVVWLAGTRVSPFLLPVWDWANSLLPQAWAWLTGLF